MSRSDENSSTLGSILGISSKITEDPGLYLEALTTGCSKIASCVMNTSNTAVRVFPIKKTCELGVWIMIAFIDDVETFI